MKLSCIQRFDLGVFGHGLRTWFLGTCICQDRQTELARNLERNASWRLVDA